MPRIPAELIESIKRDVPCRQVLEAAGAVFAKHGADVVCRCPFHDVERWSYNAYGVPTIKNSANATIGKSSVGNDRGFTGYKLDSETGLYFAKIRMYSAKLGRFTRRDPVGYVDGYTL